MALNNIASWADGNLFAVSSSSGSNTVQSTVHPPLNRYAVYQNGSGVWIRFLRTISSESMFTGWFRDCWAVASGTQRLLDCQTGSGESQCSIRISAAGDLYVYGASGAIGSPVDVSSYDDGAFHQIRFAVTHNATTGTVVVEIDGTEVFSATGADTGSLQPTYVYVYNYTSGGQYLGPCAVSNVASDLAGKLLFITRYRSTLASATPDDSGDGGDNLDTGTWGAAQPAVWPSLGSSTTQAGYTANATLSGLTILDDDGETGNGGPYNDSDFIGETALACKASVVWSRSGGGGSTHQITVGTYTPGSGFGTYYAVINGTISTSFDLYDAITTTAGTMPSSSQYGTLGIAHDGGQDTLVADMQVEVAYSYNPSTGPDPLQAATGTYAVTGSAAALKRSLQLEAATGAYSVSGVAATLLRNKTIMVETGAYVVTGQPVSFPRDYVIPAATGAYTVAGQPADLLRGYVVPLETGSYSISGVAADLQKGFVLGVETGAYSVTGSDAATLAARYLGTESTGSDSALCLFGAEDGSKGWTNDANAWDGSTATYAYTTFEGLVDLEAPLPGTVFVRTFYLDTAIPAPVSGNPSISKARYRVYCSVTGSGTPQMQVSVRHRPDAWTWMQQDYITQATPGWSDWIDIAPPPGGWGNWDDITGTGLIALYFAGQDQTGTMTEARLYAAEIEYTYSDATYQTSFQKPAYKRAIVLPVEAGEYTVSGSAAELSRGYIIGTGSSANVYGGMLATREGPYDDQSVWSNDANAFDGNGSTYALIDAFAEGVGSGASEALRGIGIENVYSGITGITQVQAEARFGMVHDCTSLAVTAAFYVDGELLGSVTRTESAGTYGAAWTGLTTLSTPTGGWEGKIDRVEVRYYISGLTVGAGTNAEARAYTGRIYISTTHWNAGYYVGGARPALTADRILQAATGSYNVSGVDPNLVAAGAFGVDTGSYAVSGQDPALKRDLVIPAETGAYTLTGSSFLGKRDLILEVEIGSYSVNGVNPSFGAAGSLPAATGNYGVSGQDAALTVARLLQTVTGSYAVTGEDARTLAAYKVWAGYPIAGDYQISGQPVGFTNGVTMGTGAFAQLNGVYISSFMDGPYDDQDVWSNDGNAFSTDPHVAASIDAFVEGVGSGSSKALRGIGLDERYGGVRDIVQVQAEARFGMSHDCTSLSLTAAFYVDGELLGSVTQTESAGTYGEAWTGLTLLSVPTGGWEGKIDRIEVRFYISAITVGAGTFAVADAYMARTTIQTNSWQSGYYVAGHQANLYKTIPWGTDAGSYDVTGQPVAFSISKSVAAQTGDYALAGQDVLLKGDFVLKAATGAFSVSGQAVEFPQTRQVLAEVGAYNVTGINPELIYSGPPATRRVIVVG